MRREDAENKSFRWFVFIILHKIFKLPYDTSQFHPELLIELVNMRMPFGKYKDRLLCDLPDHYLEWFQRKGFPKGKLGILLETMYSIKLNGLAYLLDPLKRK